MGDALHTDGGVVSAKEARLADAGLVAVQGPSLLDVRTGVMHGPGSTALVTGTSSTAPMRVSVDAHQWVTSRGAANGPYRGSLDAAVLVDIAAAPASGSRIDVVYVKQQDSTPGVPTPDGTTASLYGAVTGVSTTGTPAKPALPVGAEELATVTVAAGATATNGAGVTIANTARLTVARGAPIPVRNQAERDALTRYDGLQVFRLDFGVYETYWFGEWRLNQADKAWVDAVVTASSYSYTIPGTSYATLTSMSTSVTVPNGRTLDVEWKAPRVVLAAGAEADLQLLLGGAQKDAIVISPGTTSMYIPARLTGSVVGTGASVAIAVQGKAPVGSPLVSGASVGPVALRYRIW